MSVLFRWSSGWCFLESLGHCTGVLLVWFSRSNSESDPDTWDEVIFISDVCASTSFSCLIIIVEFSCLSIQWVSWGCCQTTSRIGGSLVVSRLSIADPEWIRGIFSLNSGLQPGYFHSSHLSGLFLGPDSVFPVFCAGEVVYWLHWFHSSIFLWSCLPTHMSDGVDNQFWLSFSSVTVFVVVVVVIILVCVVVWVRVIGNTVFVSRNNLSVSSDCSFCLFSKRHWFL